MLPYLIVSYWFLKESAYISKKKKGVEKTKKAKKGVRFIYYSVGSWEINKSDPFKKIKDICIKLRHKV